MDYTHIIAEINERLDAIERNLKQITENLNELPESFFQENL